MEEDLEIQRYDSAVEIPIDNGKTSSTEEGTKTSPSERTTGCTETQQSQETQQPTNQQQQPSRLLSLPPELQLLIWEFAVIEPQPLYLNCPCDSSYGGWTEEYYNDQAEWANGHKQPPWQPSLTRVCRSIRADALPMFYKHNQFQAGYCYETDVEMVIDWLRLVGEENRLLMTGLYFFDANERHDVNCPKDLKRVKRCAVVRELGGVLESEYGDEYCKHPVRFAAKDEGEGLEGLEELFEGIVQE